MDAEGRQEWRDATEEEAKSMWDEDIEHNRQADAQYARDVFDYWDSEISRYPKMIKVLPKMVRDAAAAYGWQAEWLRGTATIAMKECPFCGRNVRKQAVICPNTDCQQVIDYDRYAQEMAKRQAALKRYGIENADPTNLLLAGIGADPKQKPGKAA